MKIVFIEKLFNLLKRSIKHDGREKFAILLCNESGCEDIKLMPYKVIIPEEKDYLRRSSGYYEMRPEFTYRIVNQAINEQSHIVQCHSHPEGIDSFSGIDERYEKQFAISIHKQIDGMKYGSMVLSSDLKKIDSWFYDENKNKFVRTDKIIVVGKKKYMLFSPNDISEYEEENRDYLAFGEKLKIFQNLDVGIVGLSGTGGIIAEHIARIGVKKIAICDFDKIEKHNLNRLQGANNYDIGKYKVDFYSEYLRKINPELEVISIKESFYDSHVQEMFSGLDFIFGCVDSGARLSINNLAFSNLIPYFDLGAGIDIKNRRINDFGGQVFKVIPGSGVCLNCGSNYKNIFSDYRRKKDLEMDIAQGYVNAPIQNPNVYFLNTIISGLAMGEFIKYISNINVKNDFIVSYEGKRNCINSSSSAFGGCIVCRDYLGKGNKAPSLIPQDYLDENRNENPEIEEELGNEMKGQVSNEKRAD